MFEVKENMGVCVSEADTDTRENDFNEALARAIASEDAREKAYTAVCDAALARSEPIENIRLATVRLQTAWTARNAAITAYMTEGYI